jgi:single-strand DNA-binding protein
MTQRTAGEGLAGIQTEGLPEEVNRVELEGRLSNEPEARTLPSGDEIATFRVVVRRPAGAGRGAAVDTIDCVVRTRILVKRVLAWTPGSRVALEGALRHRFWRGPTGLASRTEVEVERARLMRRGPAVEPVRD